MAGPRWATRRDARSSNVSLAQPRAVGELASELPVSRPAVSQHLKVLKDAGLVIDRADGTRRIYQAQPRRTAALRAELDRFWSQALANFKTARRATSGRTYDALRHRHPIRTSIVVEAPIERAFKVFTEDFDRSNLASTTCSRVEIAETVFEPHVGGRIYDRGVDGSECPWARVLAYEPPDRVVFSWDISPRWQIETDHDKTSEVEVRFTAETPDRTRVELEHRHLDRHGEGWESERDGVAADAGWPLYLQRFADAITD